MRRDQRSREKIIEAAASLFHQRGFQPTSLDDILERSEVCRSNFYYHFRCKEDLGLEVLARQAERFETGIIRGILADETEPPRPRFGRGFGDGSSVGAVGRGLGIGCGTGLAAGVSEVLTGGVYGAARSSG